MVELQSLYLLKICVGFEIFVGYPMFYTVFSFNEVPFNDDYKYDDFLTRLRMTCSQPDGLCISSL